MKKKRNSQSRKNRNLQSDPAALAEKAKAQSRRRFLRIARNGAIALPVVAGVGFFSVRYVQATIHEADLTNIGQGKPTIVQIHDPQCMLCQTLQRQTRRALKEFDKDAVTFLVADITTRDGGLLARKYGVPHVTLLLFDAHGEMVQIVRGPSDTASLRQIFDAYLKEYG